MKDIKVTLINKEEVKDFIEKHGRRACLCYDTNPKYAKAVGKSVLKSNHMSGSRGIYFDFEFENVPRSMAAQSIRHDVGTYKNVQSFRYVKKKEFDYYTSSLIKKYPEIEEVYDDTMRIINDRYSQIVGMLEDRGHAGEKANQSARGIIPMNTNMKFVQGFTAEALFNYMNKRLCVRSEECIRQVAELMKQEVLSVLPEFEEYLVPECEKLRYCNEGKYCCGKFLTKEAMLELLDTNVVKEEIKKKKMEIKNKI
ncbi:MAG: FAD-dependent thymidylate synthase [Sarcina sp.]